MAITTYPGYEIERFEDEGGKCYIRLTPKSSKDSDAGDNNAGEKERHEKHQKPEAVREIEE